MNVNDKEFTGSLEKLPGIIRVSNVRINNGVIERASIETDKGEKLFFKQISIEDAPGLFDFYFNGLSEQSKNFWPPYPLFSPPVSSPEELAERIKDWQKEDDWTVLKLTSDEKIIGIGLLKRYKTERPTSGLAVREDRQGSGIGVLIQTVINEQARLLRLEKLVITLAQENTASFELHKKCGFKLTGELVPHYIYRDGVKEIDRQDIEMVLELSYD